MISKKNEKGAWKTEDGEMPRYGTFTAVSFKRLEAMLREAGYLSDDYEWDMVSLERDGLNIKLRSRSGSK